MDEMRLQVWISDIEEALGLQITREQGILILKEWDKLPERSQQAILEFAGEKPQLDSAV